MPFSICIEERGWRLKDLNKISYVFSLFALDSYFFSMKVIYVHCRFRKYKTDKWFKISASKNNFEMLYSICVYVLGWPKTSFGFFCNILWKNLNELFGQLNKHYMHWLSFLIL